MNKFKNYKEVCRTTNANSIIIAHIWVIWDTVDEIETNIRYALDNKKSIQVVNLDFIIKKNDLQNK